MLKRPRDRSTNKFAVFADSTLGQPGVAAKERL